MFIPYYAETVSNVVSPQTSFGVRLSVGEKRMRDKRTPKDVCGEAISNEGYKMLVIKIVVASEDIKNFVHSKRKQSSC